MFDRIARRYDLLNRLLSLGQDVRWRRRLAALLTELPEQDVLDLATGTADVLLSLFRYSPKVRFGVGLDMAPEMLALGQAKIRSRKSRLPASLVRGDATRLPFADAAFDAVTMAFGIRNVVDARAALAEMRRVLKPSGRVLILEFSLPRKRLIRWFYLLYFRRVLPVIGSLVSGDRRAYRYLNETVETFPYGKEFCEVMERSGFSNVKVTPLTFGVAAIYQGDKGTASEQGADSGRKKN